MRRRATKGDVSSLAEGFLARVDPRGKRHTAVAVTSWEKAAGADIARHTLGMAVREGELLVFVDSPAWANELSLMSEELKGRLNAEIGKDLVSSIRFTVSRHVREEKGREDSEPDTREDRPQALVPLSEAERSQVEYVARPIADDALRESAIRAMTRSLERRKATEDRNGRELRDK